MEEVKKYYIGDFETGFRREVTKEEYDEFVETLASINGRFSPSKGVVIFYGTSGELNSHEDFKKLFLDNKKPE